jgi:3-hydroxybutyryl-CoA dehydrogenase
MDSIRTVGVIGAGTMGEGIAQVCAVSGFDMLLFDVNPVQVERAIRQIDKNLDALVQKGKLTPEEQVSAKGRIKPAKSLAELRADLIIEAAVERLDVKQALFAELEVVNEGMAVLATNTSSISVSKIAASLKDPSRCIGLHFFNPADRMKLVEIISGDKTSPVVKDQISAFSRAIGKTAVMAKDSPGFIVNRVARHYYVESLKLLSDKASDVAGIDRLLRASGFKMGPFELMDLIGVDTNFSVTTSIYEGFGRAHKFAPSPIQQQLVREGHLGRKSGRGFYTYEEKK